MNVLGVLLTRATDKPLSDLFAERVTGPLRMTDTEFSATDPARMTALYAPGPDGLQLLDPPDGVFSRPPQFEELSGGLVSTAADVLRFYTAMADGGAPVLTADSLKLMTSDQLTPAQRGNAAPFVDDDTSWGLGTGLDLTAARPGMAPGRWGWTGGTGTCAYVDPSRAKVTVGTVAEQWFAGKINLRATTRVRYESALRVHVIPRSGDVRDVGCWSSRRR